MKPKSLHVYVTSDVSSTQEKHYLALYIFTIFEAFKRYDANFFCKLFLNMFISHRTKTYSTRPLPSGVKKRRKKNDWFSQICIRLTILMMIIARLKKKV